MFCVFVPKSIVFHVVCHVFNEHHTRSGNHQAEGLIFYALINISSIAPREGPRNET